MAPLRPLKLRVLLAALEKAGFSRLRQKGSHATYIHADGRRTVIPIHGNDTIGRGLLKKILRQCNLKFEDIVG